MRPLETLSLFLLFISLLFLFFNRKRTYFLTLLFLTITISILQYFIEGFRWQLCIFIYFLPAIYICHIKQKDYIHSVVKTFFSFWFLRLFPRSFILAPTKGRVHSFFYAKIVPIFKFLQVYD